MDGIGTRRLGVIQNTGFFDRILRIFVGIVLLAGGMISLALFETVSRQGYAILMSIYPLMTGMLGWDPFYSLFGKKSCRIDGRNQCGTLPFEMRILRGQRRVTDQSFDYDNSLDASHQV